MTGAAAPDAYEAFVAFDADVAQAMGQLNAATARLIELVQQCIEHDWWQTVATHSPEHWVTVRCGVAPATAHRLVRIARGLASSCASCTRPTTATSRCPRRRGRSTG